MKEKIIASAVLDPSRHRLPGRTRHIVEGADRSADVRSLQLVMYEGDPGVYLLYFGGSGEFLNDTYHPSREAAQAQAAFEFGIEARDWMQGAA